MGKDQKRGGRGIIDSAEELPGIDPDTIREALGAEKVQGMGIKNVRKKTRASALVVTLGDDPYQVFEKQCALPEKQRKHTLLIDARNATVRDVRQWLERCVSIHGFLEGSAAEWLINHVAVISNELKPADLENTQWVQTSSE